MDFRASRFEDASIGSRKIFSDIYLMRAECLYFLYANCSLTYIAVILTDLIQFNNTNNLYLLICRSARFRRNFLVYLLQSCFKTWYTKLATMYKVIFC